MGWRRWEWGGVGHVGQVLVTRQICRYVGRYPHPGWSWPIHNKEGAAHTMGEARNMVRPDVFVAGRVGRVAVEQEVVEEAHVLEAE